jgi:hypothetical protein
VDEDLKRHNLVKAGPQSQVYLQVAVGGKASSVPTPHAVQEDSRRAQGHAPEMLRITALLSSPTPNFDYCPFFGAPW